MDPTDSQRQKRMHRKTIRLPASTYNEPGLRALVTIATVDRQPAFADVNLAKDCVDLLRSYAMHHSIAVLAYCVMTDHMHLLLRVDGATGSLTHSHLQERYDTSMVAEWRVRSSLATKLSRPSTA